MTLSRAEIDDFLVAWEDDEYQAQVRTARQPSQALKTTVFVGSGKQKGRAAKTTAQRAQAVRARLARTVRRSTEVMVKITSSSKGMKQVGRHLDYISRKGLIEIEDQDGLIVRGKDQLKDLKASWRYGGPEEIADESKYRDTLNIVFSMPAHTDEVAMKRAVRAFAAVEFAGHQYVFAYHTQATDPDPNPPPHPHVHLSVKFQGDDGRRLNPRKADLKRWREGFAAELRAHGIDANATSRLARLQRDRGAKRSVLAMTAKGEDLHSVGQSAPSSSRKERAATIEGQRVAYYETLRNTLARSEDPLDRKLSAAIGEHFRLGSEPQPIPPKPVQPSKDRDIDLA